MNLRLAPRLSLALLLTVVLTSCAAAGFPVSQSYNIGTHSLHLECVGSGSPVVIIDVGAGDSYQSWAAIMGHLAGTTTVCSYDRAGYGQSEPGPLPRHSLQVANELRALLQAAALPGPYILVGHSLGAVNMQVFAAQYPDVTAGLILLDPTPLGWLLDGSTFPELTAQFEAQAQELNAQAEALLRSENAADQAQGASLQALASEHSELFGESASQAADIASFGDLPLIVINSAQPNPDFGASADAFQQFWIEQSQALAQKSSTGRFVLAEDSGHMIYEDSPGTIIIAVRDMREKVR
ncbi:MAG: alpha/beta hydrolase [Anaerolineaceae bacterium]|nr:alpha/beta hydrolase [Anaerolineaceae bacterium]